MRPGVYGKILHPETFEELPLNTEGLLFATGPNVMLGYLNKPDKTAEVIREGWYNTGDIGRIDEDGFITLTGRLSRFSKIGGEMVPHILVEEVLTGLLEKLAPPPAATSDETAAPDLRLAVTAVPDEKKGERLIVLHKPLGFPREELLRELNASGLPNLWLPGTGGFVEVPEIPLLGTGKLDLRGVKELALQLVKN
ncbi:MAG: AMP-binding protein [Planctomycetaceae bacterium]